MAAVNYLTLRSTLFYNTPGGASIPAGYMNTVSPNGVNTLWTNNAALHNTTFSTLTGSTITSVSSIGIGTSNPGYNLDVTGPTQLQKLQQSDTNSMINVRGYQNTVYSTVPFASSTLDMVCISYTGQYIAGINSGQIAVSSNYGLSFTNSSSITNPVLIKISGDGQYLLCININGSVYTVYKSSNYGGTWTSTGYSYTGANQYTLYSKSACLSYDGQYQYFLIRYNGGTVLYRSSNFGVSFTTITQPSSPIYEICCSSNGQNMILVLQTAGVYRSGDYGSTWTVGTLGYSNGTIYGISCSSSGQYAMIAGYGQPQWSDNYGATFTASTFLNDTPPPQAYWITSFSASSPYVIICNTGSSAGYLYYSTDYGRTFTTFAVPAISYQSIAVSQSAQYIIGSGSTSYLFNNSNLTTSLITTGNVGVGTAAPSANLHIYNSNSIFTGGPTVLIGDGQVDAGGTYGMLQLVRANNGADNKAHLSFIKNGLTVFGMGYYPGVSQSVFGLVPSFGTMATNAGLWLATNGYVGVGTTNPTGEFHVHMPSGTGGWQTFKVKPTSWWGDGCSVRSETAGTQYATLFDIMISNPHVCTTSTGNAVIRMGRGGGVSTGRWWEIGTLSNSKFRIGLEATDTGININTSGQVGINNASPSYTLDVNGTMRVYGAGDNTYTTYYPNGGTWNATLNVGSGTDRGTAQVLTTNGNLHLDGAPGTTIFYGYYASGRGSANSHQFYGGVTFNSNITGGEIYSNSWFRVNGGGGVYWESYGRGIWSADAAGATYGNVSVYGTGINTWNGYDINGRYTFMANGDTVGIHDRNNSWVFYNVNSNMVISKNLAVTGTLSVGGISVGLTPVAQGVGGDYVWQNWGWNAGYYKFPGGFTIQWGTWLSSDGTFNYIRYPVAFTVIYGVQATKTGGGAGAASVLDITTTTCKINSSIGSSAWCNMMWIAYGTT